MNKPSLQQISTNDNSVTFFSEKYKEWYHSKSGALEEAREKYAKPARINEKAKQKKIVLLDICFGLGYNTSVALDIIKKVNPKCRIEVFALENDTVILEQISQLNPDSESYAIVKEIIKQCFEEVKKKEKREKENKKKGGKEYGKEVIITKENIIFHLFLDDARESIKHVLKKSIDVVFLDPFSPKVCPELWTREFFKEIKKTMKEDAILTTYSCARVVRDNLKGAEFIVKDGPCIGRRAPSTIAFIDQREKE